MRKIRGAQEYAVHGPKECWHPYGLQMLQPEQFSNVVNSILRGQNRLLPLPSLPGSRSKVYQPLLPR